LFHDPVIVTAILDRLLHHSVVIINPAIKYANFVMPDLIRHPVSSWIPAFAGMTALEYLVAGAITSVGTVIAFGGREEIRI
jgi:hypothetical protein